MIKNFENFDFLPTTRLFLDDWRMPKDCAQYMWQRRVDCRIFHEEWDIVRSYGQFVNWIDKNGIPDVVSFDYDLDDVEELKEELPIEEWFNIEENYSYKGTDCLRYLIRKCSEIGRTLPKCIIHSANPDGCDELKQLIDANL
jgi:hypothetical protein